MSDGPLDAASDIHDAVDYLTELNAFIEDEDFMEVMADAVRLIAKPTNTQEKIVSMCTKLEAYSLIFRTKFVAYQSFKKGESNSTHKKNMYKEIYTGIDRLVDALKYQVR